MKKTISIIVSLGLITVGFMFGTIVSNGKNKEAQQGIEISHRHKVDSLMFVIKDKDWEIETLKEECQMKESEISFWGQMYDKCRGFSN